MNGECQFRKFNPEKPFAKDADIALETNKLTAEKVAAREQEKENLLKAIAEAREEAKESGNDKKLTELLALLCAIAKTELNQRFTAEQAK